MTKVLKILFAGLLLAQIGSVLLLSAVPPVSRDALTHHLALPKLYLQGGGIFEIPSLAFSYYPMNLDLLYMIPLYFGNDIVPKYLHFAFALATAFLLYRYLKMRMGGIYPLLGATLFLSVPVIVKLSITVYVDLGLVFFSTAAILALFRWFDSSFGIGHLVVSAVWCGLALGTKYNGLVVFVLLTLFIPLCCSHLSPDGDNGVSKAALHGIVFVVVSLLVFSPWMIRNYAWTHNPLYPLYENFFNPGSSAPENSLGLFTVREMLYGESWWQIALVPLRIFFEGQDDIPRFFDGKLNIFLGILPFFAVAGGEGKTRSEKLETRILALFSISFILIVFFKSEMRIRYIAPVIPPLVILSVLGIRQIVVLVRERGEGNSEKGFIFVLLPAFILMVWFNVSYLTVQFSHVNPFDFISGRVGRDAYISSYVPEYPTVRFANETLPENASILCLFLGNRGYYFDRQTLFHETAFSDALNVSTAAPGIRSALKKSGVTHILVRYDLMNRWRGDNYDGGENRMIVAFFSQHATLLFSENGYGLYALR